MNSETLNPSSVPTTALAAKKLDKFDELYPNPFIDDDDDIKEEEEQLDSDNAATSLAPCPTVATKPRRGPCASTLSPTLSVIPDWCWKD